jgi:hypothetical protein
VVSCESTYIDTPSYEVGIVIITALLKDKAIKTQTSNFLKDSLLVNGRTGIQTQSFLVPETEGTSITYVESSPIHVSSNCQTTLSNIHYLMSRS